MAVTRFPSRLYAGFLKFLRKRRLRPFFLVCIIALVIIEVVILTPSSLEINPDGDSATADMETLIADNDGPTLATGIPRGRIADYTVDNFEYVSTKNNERQWKLNSDRAFLFNAEKVVHTRRIKALLYDSAGKTILVTGLEARHTMNQRDMEVLGNVKAIFPDGFVIESEYIHYQPKARRISIPQKYKVRGYGSSSGDSQLSFESNGMEFDMARAEVLLPNSVRLSFDRTPSTPASRLQKQSTKIESDRCIIHRDRNLAKFDMHQSQPVESRFVRINQPGFFARSRRVELNYGDFTKLLNYMTSYEDVLFKETGEERSSLRYGTSGQADFDARTNVIVLTKFPQVYQDKDTVTGEIIKVHRDTDLVEVEHSNAYSQGK